jgi:hypothetical protein
MSKFDIDDFLSNELQIRRGVWEQDCHNRIETEYGVPRWGPSLTPGIQLRPDKPIGRLSVPICRAHVPGDAVIRLRESVDVVSEFVTIAEDTVSNILESAHNDPIGFVEDKLTEETEHTAEEIVSSTVAKSIIAPFRGDVEPSVVFSTEMKNPDEPFMKPPDRMTKVCIARLTEKQSGILASDRVYYEIKSGNEFFGNLYGHHSLMLREIIQADRSPVSKEYNIEYQIDPGQENEYDWIIAVGL